MKDNLLKPRHGRLGTWLPADHKQLANWMTQQKQKLQSSNQSSLHPVIADFKEAIRTDPIMRMALTEMIYQVPKWHKDHQIEGCDNAYLESIDQMLEMINQVLTEAPKYNNTELVGCPINAILDWCMCTPAGGEAFRNKNVNIHFQNILNVWGKYLNSSDSVSVLNSSPDGWMCPEAQEKLKMDQYEYKPHEPHWGFTSWNNFFTRSLAPNVRPIDGLHNSKVIVSACDSTVYKIRRDVKLTDAFWVKEQPYSLIDMMNNNPLASQFEGGDVYQAFLCAFDYHRWHSPVSGTIRSTEIVNGTYYSETLAAGMDVGGPDLSQGYIAHVATRAILFIEADDPKIGMICVVPIGMAEISSCIIDPKIKPGYKVQKGEELGYFQFGGSTHCVVFRPNVIEAFTVEENDKPNMGKQIAKAY